MTTTRPQTVYVVYYFFITLALLMTLGCTPTKALSDCEHNQPKNESGMVLPDFGFSLSGACNEVPSEAAALDKEDELLKDIEKPLDESASDLAVTLDGEEQTS